MKKTFLCSMLVVLMGLFGFSAYADITSNLIVYYSFDGLQSTDEVIPDLSGNNNGGSRMGGAYYVDGKFGQALECDVKDEDFAYFPDGLVADVTDFTIAGYVYKKDLNGWDRLFDFATSTDTNMFVTTNGPGNIRFAIKSVGTVDVEGNTISGEQQINCAVQPTLNAWTHIAVTIKYTDGIGLGCLYVNGVLVGTNDHITLKPSDLGYTTQNYLGRSVYSADPALNGAIDEFRMYNRALTEDDVLELTGTPAEIAKAYKEWDLTEELGLDEYISEDIALPATIYDGKVHIDWVSGDTALVLNDGKINNLPAKYPDATTLTANMWQANSFGDTTYMNKRFGVKFKPAELEEVDPLVAKFVFDSESMGTDQDGNVTIKDQGPYGFVGTVLGGARLVTMGSNEEPYGAMFIEESGGYFDMGEEIGKAIQGLADYTISIFYRKDADDNTYSSYGQHLYTFSNDNIASNAYGAIFCEPYRGYHALCTTNYGDEAGIAVGTFPMGSWHNITYVQKGNSGKLYVDGNLEGESDAVYLPCYALKAQGHNPPKYNYIGKPCYFSDPWTTNTHFSSLTIYNIALSASDLEDPDIIGITSQLEALDAAYAQNPEVVGEDFQQEYDQLTIASMTDLKTGDILDLPTQGSINPAIKISWVSSHPEYLSSEGIVVSPKYFPLDSVVLIATLQQGTTTKSKSFSGNIILDEEGGYKGDVLADWDFSKAKQDSVVIDQAEMKFEGSIENEAYIATIGTGADQVNVLYLAEGTGYFDMGQEIGKAIVGLKDYTVSVYYRKDDEDGTLTAFTGYGQPLYAFGNSQLLASEAYGAMYYEPLRDRHVCTPDNYGSEGTNYVGTSSNNMVGSWHNITFVQQGDSGTLYHDGFAQVSMGIGTPAKNLWRFGMSGTIYNYIGHPLYTDPYLQKTMIAQLKIWTRALSETELNEGMDAKIAALDLAYEQNNGQGSVLATDLKIEIENAETLSELNYAGKAELDQAIIKAEQAIADNNVTQETIDELKAAERKYLFTKPGSAAQPADYTFAITNPSFEDGWAGTLQEGSIQESGSYTYPTGWEVYTNCAGWCNVAKITDNPADGTYAHETWAATINEFDIHQYVELPAGWYILSAVGRTNAGTWDTKTYATVGEETYYSETFDENMNVGVSAWNGVDNWQTLFCTFEVKEAGEVKIGLNSHSFMQFDNFRLQFTGSDKPAVADYSYAITNPSFEEGDGGIFDPESKGGNGNYQAPLGWTVYYNTEGAGWTNCVITNAPSTSAEGEAHGYETWSGSITAFQVAQTIVAPASGWYTVSADMRCDASSISKTDSLHPFDAHLIASVQPYGKYYSSVTLFEAAGLTENPGAWIDWTNVETDAFYAAIGEEIDIYENSTSFVQMDNFRLNYKYNNEPESELELGDINGDGNINVGDMTGLVNIILGIQTEGLHEEVADVNEDTHINVGDCVALTNKILGTSNVASLNADGISARVFADDFSLAAGESFDMAINFAGAENIAAMQMDITLPAGLTFESARLAGSSHSLATSVLSNGSIRVLGYSSENAMMDASSLIVTVRANASAAGMGRVELGNILVAGSNAAVTGLDAAYATVTFSVQSGLESVMNEESREVYNILGQKVNGENLRSGVYVINGKKTVVR